jgi:hypothetical protein
MFTVLFTTSILAVVYGLVWHNRSARDLDKDERDEPGKTEGEDS